MYRAAWPAVHGLARRMVDTSEADDIAQQALLAVFSRASEFDAERGAALPWILGITGWTVRTHRKRCARRREVAVPEGLLASDDPEAHAMRRDLEDAAREVLGRLSDLDRETLLAAMDERPSGATFRKRLQRALERFRTTFRRTHGTL